MARDGGRIGQKTAPLQGEVDGGPEMTAEPYADLFLFLFSWAAVSGVKGILGG